MISKPDMGAILSPLEKRFKKLTSDQTEIYHDRLKYQEKRVLQAAVASLVDNAKAFPTPGEVKKECRSVSSDRPELAETKRRGCSCCHDGYVFYTRPVNEKFVMYVCPCAHCHKGETRTVPFLTQRDDAIYYSCARFQAEGRDLYRSAPDIEEPFPEADPVRTSEQLKNYFHDR